MTPRTGDPVHPLLEAGMTRQDQEVVELPLLLPKWQAVELEAAARQRGMTMGQLLRRVIRQALDDSGAGAPS
jgi:hypothetical protein